MSSFPSRRVRSHLRRVTGAKYVGALGEIAKGLGKEPAFVQDTEPVKKRAREPVCVGKASAKEAEAALIREVVMASKIPTLHAPVDDVPARCGCDVDFEGNVGFSPDDVHGVDDMGECGV